MNARPPGGVGALGAFGGWVPVGRTAPAPPWLPPDAAPPTAPVPAPPLDEGTDVANNPGRGERRERGR
eukprot:11208656-Lingulodinium_polyedra.AAC.1